MTESELAKIMAEVFEQYGVPGLGEGEFTQAMFAQAQGITYEVGGRILQRALNDGAIAEVGQRKLTNGHTATAYRRC